MVDVQVFANSDLQRTDWRGAARLMGPPRIARILFVQPGYATTALAVYGHPTVAVPGGAQLREIDVVGQFPARNVARKGPNGFRLVQLGQVPGVTLLRYERAQNLTFTPQLLASAGARLVLEPSLYAGRWIADYVKVVRAWRTAAAEVQATKGSVPMSAAQTLAAGGTSSTRFAATPPELPQTRTLYRELTAAGRAAQQLAVAPPSQVPSRLLVFQRLLTRLRV
jgi:hypothetical protein